MKSVLVVFILISFHAYTQNSKNYEKELLPAEIKEYYYNLNLVNSFSTKSERSILTKYLDTQDIKQKPESKRLIFIMNLLDDIRQRHLEEWTTMGNKFKTNHTNFPYLNEIQFYHKSEDLILVRLKVYQINVSDNFKIINMFDESKDEIIKSDKLNNLSQPTYFSDEIHEWVLLQGYWQKRSVRKVLTNN